MSSTCRILTSHRQRSSSLMRRSRTASAFFVLHLSLILVCPSTTPPGIERYGAYALVCNCVGNRKKILCLGSVLSYLLGSQCAMRTFLLTFPRLWNLSGVKCHRSCTLHCDEIPSIFGFASLPPCTEFLSTRGSHNTLLPSARIAITSKIAPNTQRHRFSSDEHASACLCLLVR